MNDTFGELWKFSLLLKSLDISIFSCIHADLSSVVIDLQPNYCFHFQEQLVVSLMSC